MTNITIRPVGDKDYDALWAILEPVLREGETYSLPRDWTKDEAVSYWCLKPHQAFVAVAQDKILGTYYLQPNRLGGGAHVANAGFVTALWATGKGVARTMCGHALTTAKGQGFLAMQFNMVISSNSVAISLWSSMGFETLARLPEVFSHPRLGLIDAFLMFRKL
jgi:ribosomal protein S18 acetylase RimI-like enzyme